MTTDVAGDSGSPFTPDEDAFFSSGGEKPLASESGSDNTGDTGNDAAGGSDKTPDADKAGDKGDDKGENKTVSLKELQEEREARKAAKEENRKLNLQIAELTGKFSILERLGKPAGEATEQPKGPVKPEDDIFDAVNDQGLTLAQIQKRLDDADAEKKAVAERTAFVDNYKSDAAKFTAEKAPDYKEAYNFLLSSRAAELQAIGYDTPQALHEALTADEFAIAQRASTRIIRTPL